MRDLGTNLLGVASIIAVVARGLGFKGTNLQSERLDLHLRLFRDQHNLGWLLCRLPHTRPIIKPGTSNPA